MWKIIHRLFGIDFVMIEGTYIRRVRHIWWRGDGMPMVSLSDTLIFPLVPPYRGYEITPLTKGAIDTIELAKELAADTENNTLEAPCQTRSQAK